MGKRLYCMGMDPQFGLLQYILVFDSTKSTTLLRLSWASSNQQISWHSGLFRRECMFSHDFNAQCFFSFVRSGNYSCSPCMHCYQVGSAEQRCREMLAVQPLQTVQDSNKLPDNHAHVTRSARSSAYPQPACIHSSFSTMGIRLYCTGVEPQPGLLQYIFHVIFNMSFTWCKLIHSREMLPHLNLKKFDAKFTGRLQQDKAWRRE